MNFFKIFFFPRSRKDYINLFEFFCFVETLYNSLSSDYLKNKNPFIKNFLNLLGWLSSQTFEVTKNYSQLLRDSVFWESRYYYKENLEKYIDGTLTNVELIDQILYQILSQKREANELRKDFSKQANIVFESKSFRFSTIPCNLVLILEAFDEDEEDTFISEEEFKKAIQLALTDIKKYF